MDKKEIDGLLSSLKLSSLALCERYSHQLKLVGLVGLLAACFISFATFSMAFSYVFPWADDYDYSAVVVDYGYWEAQKNLYLSWSGRYSATALMTSYYALAQFFSVSDVLTYRYSVAFVFLLALISLFSLFYFSIQENHFTKLLLVFSGTFLWFIITYDITEALFWLPGAFTYTVPAFLLVFLTLGCWHVRHSASPLRNITLIPLAILSVLLPGFVEPLGIWVLIYLFLWMGIEYSVSRRLIWQHLVVAVFVVIGLSIVILSPGNDVRSESVNAVVKHTRNPAYAIAGATFLGSDFFLRIININTLIWFGAVFLFGLYWKNQIRYQVVVAFALWLPVALLCIPLTFAIGSYFTGGTLPPRVQNCLFFLLMIGGTGTSLLFAFYSKWQKDLQIKVAAASFLLIFALGGKEFHVRIAHEFLKIAPTYKAEVVAMRKKLEASEKNSIVLIEKGSASPSKITRFWEPSTDPNHNGSLVRFYKLKEVRVASD